jgi:hypothetical protein
MPTYTQGTTTIQRSVDDPTYTVQRSTDIPAYTQGTTTVQRSVGNPTTTRTVYNPQEHEIAGKTTNPETEVQFNSRGHY